MKDNKEAEEIAKARKEKAEQKKAEQKKAEAEAKAEAERGGKRYDALCLFLQQFRDKDYEGFTAEAVKKEVIEEIEKIILMK